MISEKYFKDISIFISGGHFEEAELNRLGNFDKGTYVEYFPFLSHVASPKCRNSLFTYLGNNVFHSSLAYSHMYRCYRYH